MAMRSYVMLITEVSDASEEVSASENPLVPGARAIEERARRELGAALEVGQPRADATSGRDPGVGPADPDDPEAAALGASRRYDVRVDSAITPDAVFGALVTGVEEAHLGVTPGPYSLVVALLDDAGHELARRSVTAPPR
jgi:hypothetical protein